MEASDSPWLLSKRVGEGFAGRRLEEEEGSGVCPFAAEGDLPLLVQENPETSGFGGR